MTNELMTIEQQAVMPVMDVKAAILRRNQFVSFVKEIMVEGVDYGTVPGTNKPTLLKPGAEKLSTFFGLSPSFQIVGKIEDWDKPLFHYQYKCKLYRGDRLIGEGVGSCNSLETKYRWRWVSEEDIPPTINLVDCMTRRSTVSEFKFAIEKAETTGQYGKPQEYWDNFKAAIKAGEANLTKKKTKSGQEYDAYEIETIVYRISNEEVYSQINTIDKMAQKRALVAATLVAVNASEFFTQDLEDFDLSVIDVVTEVLPESTSGNGHNTDPGNGHNGKQKEYKFPNAASREFFDKVQEATGNYYKDAWKMTQVISGKAGQWFNFGDEALYEEKLSLAVDHARKKKEEGA